jgi:hypothetical protein
MSLEQLLLADSFDFFADVHLLRALIGILGGI